jgi:glycosyltransferase involved in cell wall biosynthesis
MRVLMLVQQLDERDWLRAFILNWVRALAACVKQVDVITLELGQASLPENVTVQSMGKERGYSRLRELWEFNRALARTVPHVDVIFTHMTPRYTWIAAPYALLFNKPQVLWFVHRNVSIELRLAHALADRVVTASPESFTLPSRKVTVLGHGVDLARFHPADRLSHEHLILSVGRLSPIKNHAVLLQVAARLATRPGFEDVRFAIAGGETPENPDHSATLYALARELGVEKRVSFLGAVPHADIPALYHRAALTVNLCPTGGLDKAVLESMASGVPAIVHNRTFLPLLGEEAPLLWCETLDPDQIADHIASLLNQPLEARLALGKKLATRVQAEYSLDGLMDKLVAVFEDVISRRKAGRHGAPR